MGMNPDSNGTYVRARKIKTMRNILVQKGNPNAEVRARCVVILVWSFGLEFGIRCSEFRGLRISSFGGVL